MVKIKKILLVIFVMLGTDEVSFSQIKILKATQQKTFAGMGGVFMNYLVEFNRPKNSMIEVDSVFSIADSSSIKFGYTKFEPCCKNQVTFGYVLSGPAKCKTCPDMIPNQPNLTKGIILYCRKGEKKIVLKVKKFKQLPDLRTP